MTQIMSTSRSLETISTSVPSGSVSVTGLAFQVRFLSSARNFVVPQRNKPPDAIFRMEQTEIKYTAAHCT